MLPLVAGQSLSSSELDSVKLEMCSVWPGFYAGRRERRAVRKKNGAATGLRSGSDGVNDSYELGLLRLAPEFSRSKLEAVNLLTDECKSEGKKPFVTDAMPEPWSDS